MIPVLNKKRIACSVAIVIFCLVGDRNSKPRRDADLAAAICDNVTHAIVGVFTWMGVLAVKSDISDAYTFLQILICGMFSSLVDIDHFISVKSFNLKEAVSLTHRPIFHCTSGALLVCCIILTVAFKFHITWLYSLGWMLVAAFLSHHVRDSIRRGLWLWPFGSTKPTPQLLYLASEALLPYTISAIISYLGSAASVRKYDSIV